MLLLGPLNIARLFMEPSMMKRPYVKFIYKSPQLIVQLMRNSRKIVKNVNNDPTMAGTIK